MLKFGPFFYALLFISFCEANVLCVDIGGTRTKYALLEEELTFDQLKEIEVKYMYTEDWLSKKLPTLFSPKNPTFSKQLKESNKIAISIRGPIYDHAFYLYRPRGIPYYIKDEIESASNLPVCIENDAISFIHGALELIHLENECIQYPALAITLGTGCATAIALDRDTIIGYELYNTPEFSYDEYAKAYESLLLTPPCQWLTEGPLGTRMLQRFPKGWDKTTHDIAYRQLFENFVKDVKQYLASSGIEIKSLLIGQGHSRFLETKNLLPDAFEKTFLFSPEVLEKKGLSADILSVLGPWDIHIHKRAPAAQSPSFESVYTIE